MDQNKIDLYNDVHKKEMLNKSIDQLGNKETLVNYILEILKKILDNDTDMTQFIFNDTLYETYINLLKLNSNLYEKITDFKLYIIILYVQDIFTYIFNEYHKNTDLRYIAHHYMHSAIHSKFTHKIPYLYNLNISMVLYKLKISLQTSDDYKKYIKDLIKNITEFIHNTPEEEGTSEYKNNVDDTNMVGTNDLDDDSDNDPDSYDDSDDDPPGLSSDNNLDDDPPDLNSDNNLDDIVNFDEIYLYITTNIIMTTYNLYIINKIIPHYIKFSWDIYKKINS